MFEVTYVLETLSGKTKNFVRTFFDEDMVKSEQTFQPGSVLTDGTKIKSVSFRKVKK